MKKAIFAFIAILVALTVTAVSCKKDPLEEVVYSTLTSDLAFTSAENAEAAVVSMYAPMRDVYYRYMNDVNDVSVDLNNGKIAEFDRMNDEKIFVHDYNRIIYSSWCQVATRANIVIDDTLLIYYGEFQNEIQARLVSELRASPYRNYIKRPVPDEEVIYFMLIYPDEKIEEIYGILAADGITEKLKVLKYKSNDYKGYSYIKIYNKTATRQNMIEYLKRNLGVEKTVTFGTIPQKYDYVVEEGNTNQVVHKIKGLFEN